MIIVKQLCKMIREELADAEKYAKEYRLAAEKDQKLAETFKRLANEELDHSNMLHAEAVRKIKEYNTPAPESMQAVWNWEHELMIEQTAKIKQMLTL